MQVTLALMLYKVPIHLDQALLHANLANGSSFLNIMLSIDEPILYLGDLQKHMVKKQVH